MSENTDITDADWVHNPASHAVMSALGDAYFVGGCVRNTLLGAPVADIDIATPILPKDVIDCLKSAGIKTVPTGIEHGTVTAVCDGTPIEITTFRADISTDGRRATVAFTTDMRTDAARRDFTMNALYADASGRVIDPLGGLPDLRARSVRFIGLAEDRIREDYLRILRFFRFHAWYGADGIDQDGLAACAALADGLDDLARERIGWEVRKLLAAPDPGPAVAAMAATGILARILPGAMADMLPVLVHAEAEAALTPDWRTRLVAMGGSGRDQLRLSKAEARTVADLSKAVHEDTSLGEIAYRHGTALATGAALIRAASTSSLVPADQLDLIARAAHAKFPLKAKHLTGAGMSPGPDLGAALARAEAAWIASSFSLDKDALLQQALDRSQ